MPRERPSFTVAALAGRRIDPPCAPVSRFSLARVPGVQAALAAAFERHRVGKLVCSAACGADLVALSVAERLGIDRRVVLPFDDATFRETSVVDRPGDWGPVYDRLIADVRASGDLVILDGDPGAPHAYSEVNHTIVREASVGHGQRLAFVVWEGRAHSVDDSTEEFRQLADKAGFTEVVILTC